ncbi:hypothetical protein POL68_20010 [Stigmatella sp. ncwal1]|uniref:Uncharacterized protein n=1 Tax=Stigmatella ashevillensis TaxID=2995309 RepID=A0ABT5DAU4_9BACT|nr:hypothetical protein [Stigmatella ashevillena]MDC0710772.1 hypothetical protein [Stigmatella ashevillena]
MTRPVSPDDTMFERFVVFEQEYLEIGRRYLQALGLPRGIGALVEDLNEGRLAWEKGRHVLGHVPYLLIEYIARRAGFTRFRAISTDPEFVALKTNSFAQVLQRHGTFPPGLYAGALEAFSWNALRHWQLVAHDLGGRHAYAVTPSLAQLVRQPETLSQPWRTPRLPVPSLMLMVPPEAGLTLTQRGFRAHAVTELYVIESLPPVHQWSVWIHAPVDEHFAESLYVELPLPPGSSLQEGIENAQDLFLERRPIALGWQECVRWLGAILRALAEGGARLLEGPSRRRILLGAVKGLH